LRVLQISKFYAPILGGIERVALELFNGMRDSGLHPHVLCSNHRLTSQREVSDGGYEICRAGKWGTVLSTPLTPTMPQHLWRLTTQTDIVHLHMPNPMAAAAVWMVRPQVRLVVHWHSDVVRQRKAMKIYEPLQRWVLDRADAIIATSEPYARSSAALAPWKHKTHVIPIGVSDERARVPAQRVRELRSRFPNKRVIFALGRMTYYKGFEVLIDAAKYLPEDCVVLIGGDGSLLQHHRQLVERSQLSEKVHMLGHIHGDDLLSHFEACDIFCLSSTVRSEAYGVVMVEAMMMAKPIVATNIEGSGVPWVNKHGLTGLNAPAGDSKALAASLRHLLNNESLRKRFGQAARLRYESEFLADRMVNRTIELYRQLPLSSRDDRAMILSPHDAQT